MATCVVPTCERPQEARGLCMPHYHRWRRRGEDADFVRPIGPRTRATEWTWNPWTAREPCPQCASAESTMPMDPGDDSQGRRRWPEWRCVDCGLTFLPTTDSPIEGSNR